MDTSKILKVPTTVATNPSIVSVSKTPITDKNGKTWKVYFDRSGNPVGKEQVN